MINSSDSKRRKNENDRAAPIRLYFLLILVLALLWLAFSGKFDPLHISYGVLSIALVLLLSRQLLTGAGTPVSREMFQGLHMGRALRYPFWLVWQILLANIQVAWIVIDPKMPIDPVLVRFRCGMQGDLAKVVLGNSITLTPGTFTLRIRGDEFLVHAIRPDLAAGLIDGSMQRKVAAVFGEEILSSDEMQLDVLRDMNAFVEDGL
jgi:multicomponent Na+:H+ antiporter subunit E